MNSSTTKIVPPLKAIADQLNNLLSHEIALTDMYEHCLRSITPVHSAFELCRDSHLQRCVYLREAIHGLSEKPTDNPKIIDRLQVILMSGASLFGDSATLALLEQAEEDMVEHYRTTCNQVDVSTCDMLRDEFLPKALHALSTIHDLHKTY